MKKSLVALAVVGAFSAPAFADTTLYGIADVALANVSNTGQRSQTLVVTSGLAPSQIGVKGAEDLGGGLKAVYQLEFNIDMANNTTIGGNTPSARKKFAGLSGDWGTAVGGYLQTAAFDYEVKYDPTAGSSVSAYQNVAIGGNFLIQDVKGLAYGQRALAYISPDMSGLKVAVNYSTAAAGLGDLTLASGAPSANVTATLVSATYDNGPASVGLIYAGESLPAGGNNPSAWSIGGSYDFGVAKLYGTYQSDSNTNAASSSDKMYSVSGVIPAGPGAAVLTYARSNMTAVNTNGSAYTAAYLYSFSKTATLYGAYSHVNNDSGTAGYSVDNGAVATATATAGGSSNLVAIGLKKSF